MRSLTILGNFVKNFRRLRDSKRLRLVNNDSASCKQQLSVKWTSFHNGGDDN